jgi:ribonuclease E
VAQGSYQIGDVFLGTVEQVRAGIDAAFVILGENEKNVFLPVSELGPLRSKKATAGIRDLLEPD